MKTNRKEIIAAFAFLLPGLIVLLITVVGPLLYTLYYSFLDYNMLRPKLKTFVGISNYINAFNDELVFKSIINTFYFVIFVVPLQTLLGFAFALLVNRIYKETIFFKVAFFSPTIMSLAVISALWMIILNPSNGLLNSMLGKIGIESQQFLFSTKQAMPSIICISAWQGCGTQMLILLAGLKNIPPQLYEASSIDGASKLQQFFYITIPNLKNTFYFIFITITIQAFKLIVQPMIMTNGGPLNSTKTILFYIFENGFRFRNVGYASAISVMFIIMVVIISMIQQKLSKKLND